MLQLAIFVDHGTGFDDELWCAQKIERPAEALRRSVALCRTVPPMRSPSHGQKLEVLRYNCV